MQELVLVTGGSGFVGAHCILALLRQNYRVRTTLRSLKRTDEVRDLLRAGGADEVQVEGVEFAAADLSKDDGWREACRDCTYVLHVASPFPLGVPKHPDELIVPAREGTLRVLRAAKEAGTVKRVVVTSSFAAIGESFKLCTVKHGEMLTNLSLGYGHGERTETFTEKDWTNPDSPDTPAYPQSKTIAEKAAWDWIAREGGSLELSVVNPVGIFGPILGKDAGTSVEAVLRLLNGQLPGVPKLQFGVVDVRDLAELELKAMVDPRAKGERFLALCDGPFLSFQEIAQSLKKQLGEKAKNVPTRTVPNFAIRMAGWFDPAIRMITPELGKTKTATNAKAKETLGWQPRSADEALKASAESCYEFGLVK